MSDSKESAEAAVAGHAHHEHRWLRRILKFALAVAVLVYFAVAAVFIGLRYVVLPRIDDFRPRIETLVSSRAHADVRIGKLAPYWSGFEPGVDVTDLVIRDAHGTRALSVPHATATLSWGALLRGKPALASLVIERPDVLAAREPDGSLWVGGVQVPTTHTGNDTFSTWLLSQQAIVLRGGTLRWRDALLKAPELALHDVRIAILNDGLVHRVALQAPAEGTLLKGPLDFRARFRHTPLMSIGKPQNWTGQAYVSTGPVELPILARYVKLPVATYAGRVDNAIWASFSGGHIRSAHGKLEGSDIALRVRPTQPQLDMPVAHFGWTLSIQAQRDYRLQLTNLRAELGQPPLPDGTPVSRTLTLTTLTGRYRVPTVEHGQLMSVTGDRVDLGILAEFTRALPVPRRFLDELVRFDPRGMVANYTIAVERARPTSALAASEERVAGTAPIVRYRFKGDLQGISLAAQEPPPGLSPAGHPRAGLPGFENLWGSIDADERHGTITLDTVNAAVTIPGEFDDPRLTFDRLRMHGNWTVSPTRAPGDAHKAFSITVPDLSVENADTAGSLAATYTNPGHGRGALDLKATIARANVPAIARYLPTSIGEHLRDYLGHGLQEGVARNATIEVHGNLDKFPYSREPKAGIFRIVAPFSGGRFDPSPYPPKTLKNGTPDLWPALEGIDGVFTLKENKLRFDIDRAHYKRVAITRVAGHIDDLGNRGSNLVVDGNAHGPLADLLDYVNHSAVAGMTGHVADKLRASGPAGLALTLTVPRTPNPHVDVAGTVTLDGNTLSAPQLPPLEALGGQVRFTKQTLSLERVAGRWLGGEVRATGALQDSGGYAFDVAGRIAADSARQLDLDGPAAKILGHVFGAAPYSISVRGKKGALPTVSATSDLTGLALDLPAPLGKSLGTPMPLSFEFKPLGAGEGSGNAATEGMRARADLRLGPVEAAYMVERRAGGNGGRPSLAVLQGAIGLNAPARLPPHGVTATLTGDSFDADAWRTFADELRTGQEAAQPAAQPATQSSAQPAQRPPRPASAPPSRASQFMPSRIAARFKTLKLLNRPWSNVAVDATQASRSWQANLTSDEVSGSASWQPGAADAPGGQLHARLTKASIPVAVGHDLLGQLTPSANQPMPAIDLVIDDLTMHGHDIGRLAVNAHNFDEDGVPVWQVDKLDVSNPAAHLLATANWRTSRQPGRAADADMRRRTVVDFKLDVADAGALLGRFGLPRTVKGGSGSLSGKAVWRGGPTAIDYPTLDGRLSMDLHHGQILKVDPAVAKLLGVLSLQSLTRVLTLNFRDVIGEGLPFERVSGTALVRNGIARTDDFRVVTAPMRADLAGSVDFAQETQDLHVVLTPTLNAGSAVIAATVVNPLFGLGALVANAALSQSISRAFAHDYAITGSWSHPLVERVAADRGKMAAPAEATGQ
ncbi:YhdP family phospholipid transporter [Trinickia acidisoli]|uniref:YhdP family phospholipid transporter n=1 Tax=Trinickia acidisoli TaxID=2767482 RepID=UPI001A8EF155|nr:AsmA-like C-terminal region-containing protein [Trinickia acidisoli]